ncbi:hypothetical protein ACI3PL_30775, partial [Lacticaseibacillus paracasei]
SFIEGIGGEQGIANVMRNFISAAKSIFIPVFEGIKFAFDKIKSAVDDNKESFKALADFLVKYVAPFLGGALKIAIEGIG